MKPELFSLTHCTEIMIHISEVGTSFVLSKINAFQVAHKQCIHFKLSHQEI